MARQKGQREAKNLVVLRCSEHQPSDLEPMWQGMIYLGEATMLYGAKGRGKSTIANDIIACVTTGRPFPCERETATRSPRSVVILTAEDHPTKVIIPQLIAAGAEMRNVFLIPSATLGLDKRPTSIDLAVDLHQVEECLDMQAIMKSQGKPACDPVGLVVISPVTAYLGQADSNSSTAVRNALDPLIAMVRRHNAACLLIGHPRKSTGDGTALNQLAGTSSLTDAPRVCVYAMQDPNDDAAPRLLLRAASNVDDGGPRGYAYRIQTRQVDARPGWAGRTSGVNWIGRDDRDPDEVLRQQRLRDDEERKANRKGDKVGEATFLILQELLSGPKSGSQLSRARQDAHVTSSSFDRARSKLVTNRIVRKRGDGRDVMWELGRGHQEKMFGIMSSDERHAGVH